MLLGLIVNPSKPFGNALFGSAGILALGLVALLSACQTSRSPELLPVEDRSQPALQVEEGAVERLLAAAEQAMAEDRLTIPEAGSAFALYQELLALVPDHAGARRGLEKIVERYVQLALRAAERQRFPQARSMLARARLVDPAHPAIEPTGQQVALLEGARRERVPLDRAQLQRRAAALAQRLQRLGGRAGRPGCRVSINARSDAEGRWVYQQLNRGAGAVRVRANLRVASPPTVELICFANAG